MNEGEAPLLEPFTEAGAGSVQEQQAIYMTELMNAIMGALDAHHSMSTQALNWEALRERAGQPAI